MATISSSQDLDSASRSAGEAFTVDSGAILTINTDTRWHKNAPTGVNWGTGSLAALTANAVTGGTILIDSRNVRWIPYTGGGGNVPALGTTITGLTSGVTGELLGVYSALNVAPTAAGSGVPPTGFLKFKSTSGTFNSSEALSGITASTNGTQVVGWIEVTIDDGVTITISRTSLFQTRGDWFYLDPTTGVRAQAIQCPNPGGANFYVPGVWIEDCFLTGAITDDGGVQTDETAKASSDTTNDMTLLPAVPVVNDAYYFGYDPATFTELQLYLSTQGVGAWTITWEYWDGAAWSALSGVSDGSTGFTAATGWKTITWTLPGDWAKTVVRNRNAYWIRARVSAYTSVTTQPKGQQAGVVGSGVYELWPAVTGDTYFGTSHLGTDERSRFVQCYGSGLIRIGQNGAATNVGALPVPGCRVRIPNILIKSCATGSRASDSVPNSTLGTRPDFTTTSAGRIDIEYTIGHWYLSLGQTYSTVLKHSAFFDQITLTESATAIELDDVGNGNYNNGDTAATTLTSNFSGGTLTDCKFGRTGTIANNDYGTNCGYCFDLVFTRCHFQNRAIRTNANGLPAYIDNCSGLEFYDCVVVGNSIRFLACADTYIEDLLYADWFHTTSSGTNAGVGAIYVGAGSVNTKIVGGGWYTAVANVHHDACYLYCLGATGVRWQECGSRSYPITGGDSNVMLYAFADGGNNKNLEFKRVYFSELATRFLNWANSSKTVTVENCAGDYGDALGTGATAGFVCLDGDIKGLAAASQYTAFTSVYGTVFYSIYTSTAAGRIGLAFNEDTTRLVDYITKSFSGASGFTSTGTLAIQVLNDYVIYEFPYWIYGIDSFQNADPTLSGTNTGNHTVEYQIDTGSGWNGTWKAATGANLSGESFTASGGFRFKVRITCNADSTTNALTRLYCLTNADTAAQDVMYPLDSYPVTVTVVDKDNVAIQDAQVAVYVGVSQVVNADTDALGVAEGVYSSTVPANAIYKVRKSSTGSTRYTPSSGPAVITSSGMSVKVVLYVDPDV